MMEEFSLSLMIGWRGVFNKVQLHRELAEFAFERRNVGFVLGNDACLFIVQIAAIELRKP
ncbi:hypothetical protein ACQZ44_00660 [Agrobacterium vitis]